MKSAHCEIHSYTPEKLKDFCEAKKKKKKVLKAHQHLTLDSSYLNCVHLKKKK